MTLKIKSMRIFSTFALFIFSIILNAQNATVKGKVTDAVSHEALPGVSIFVDANGGTSTDLDGNYELKLSASQIHKLEYKFLGYKSFLRTVNVKDGETMKIDASLTSEDAVIDEVVVSAGKFEQNIGEVTVSMEVLKPALINNKNTTQIDNAIDQIPGVEVVDGSANIRGGSGWTYGAGSRVLVLVDDLPLLTAGVSDVQWNFIPVENLSQVEVIKGASSALFGSSALNGVIHMRTAYPTDKPETKITTFMTYYDSPANKDMKWWGDTLQLIRGISFSHSVKLDNVDLITGGNYFDDDGYIQGAFGKRSRFNVNTRWRSKKIEGLSAGINFNTQVNGGGNVLYWLNSDSGGLKPAAGTLSDFTYYKTTFDPFVTYFTPNGCKHSLRTRYFRTYDVNNTQQGFGGDQIYAEYQFQKEFNKKLVLTLGAMSNFTFVKAVLFGDHKQYNYAIYGQVDKKWNRITLSFGARSEYFKLDSTTTLSNFVYVKPYVNDTVMMMPVMLRSGINYQLFEYTYLRASYGQGYRYPSISEKYIETNAGGIQIFPNHDLLPETGWSAEIGVKQGVKIFNWKGYLDVAGFWTTYNSMMEFTFTAIGGKLGFQSQNNGNARINGIDISLVGDGKIGPINVAFMGGYTYMDPIDLNFDPNDTTISETDKILKYHYHHQGKFDVELGYKIFSLGMSYRYTSFMVNIDKVFESVIPDVASYRAEHNTGVGIMDFRAAVQIATSSKVSLIVNNATNVEYTERPAFFQPFRTFTIQYALKF